MNKFIPLSSLKDTTGIVELCNKAGEPVVVNRNGELKLVIMTLEAITIQKLKNPAEIVRICESIDMPFPIIRNGYNELYVMSYKKYLRRKTIINISKKIF